MSDPEALTSMSVEELEALADSQLAPTAQARLDDLLARHAEKQLAPEERQELDRLLQQIDQLTILKTRARYTLSQRHAETAGS
jgi:hypothetical protein